MPDFVKLKGGVPYGSELFGIYQPLLGWKSKQNKERIIQEQESKLKALIDSSINTDRTIKPPPWMDQDLFEYIRVELERAINVNKGKSLSIKQWEAIFSEKNLAKDSKQLIIADVMKLLSKNFPQLLPQLFQKNNQPMETQKQFIDSLADFDQGSQLAVLSPIGIMHLFREYFFELDTFLGPPVGHVWISPGGVVELLEVNTRRSTSERMVETLFESKRRSELSTIEQEDLADAVCCDNLRNIKLGISGSAVVYHAGANANIDFESTHKLARESAHKLLREQSQKLSREICRNFKTTFRTSTEVQDSSSRRYVLENKTNKLLNYELHRKMRKVGVQVQHVGTQLCWQVYINEPGKELGLAELVHLAKPTDTLSSIIQDPRLQDTGSYHDYIKAVRERIRIGSNIKKRNSKELREEEKTVVYHRLLQQLMQIGSDQSIPVTSEIIRSIFDIDNMLYFAASDWWKARERQNYLITEDSEPAPLGSSLGWLLQLDGDNHRNAFLNTPWIKVVMPILPGREITALDWLKLDHIEGVDGFADLYHSPEAELEGNTIGETLYYLAKKVSELNRDIQNNLSAETLYETGFAPLDKGFQLIGALFGVFDQWVEALPTDQIVALEYDERNAK